MLIVIPTSPVSFCGLADHAGVIAGAIRSSGAAGSARSVGICTWPEARACAPGTTLLLEYTPLAYSPVGLSWRLLADVTRWRCRGCRVITFFHELPFSNGPGWKPPLAVLVQRGHCILLAALSSAVVVNQLSGLGWLSLLRGRRRVSFLPSCSNVGESNPAPPPLARPLQVVVFGSPGKRRHAHALVAELGGYRQIFGREVRVIDIGEPLPLPEALRPEVECLGPLPSAAVRAELLRSRYGFFHAEPRQFPKSGVFAAYCANGVVPVIACPASPRSPHYLVPDQLQKGFPDVACIEGIWREGRQWSMKYSTRACADWLQTHWDER